MNAVGNIAATSSSAGKFEFDCILSNVFFVGKAIVTRIKVLILLTQCDDSGRNSESGRVCCSVFMMLLC